jgi:hypothetical protein
MPDVDVEGKLCSRKVIGGYFVNQIRLQKTRNIADGDGESCRYGNGRPNSPTRRPAWLAGGVILYVMDGPYPIPFPHCKKWKIQKNLNITKKNNGAIYL